MKTLSPEQQAQIAKEDATPNDELTPAELKRKTDRIKKRESRDRLKAKKIANTAEGVHDFWESNRKAMNQTALSNLMVQHEAVLDQLYWMDYGENVAPEDPDFVSLEEGIDDLLRFVKEHGVVHLGFISKNDLPADWMCRSFWQDSELMARLKDENPQTETYVMYGLFAALPDWRVIEFLTKKTGAAWSWQKAADFVGYRIVGNTCCYGRGKTLFEAWGHAKEVKTPPAKPVTTIHIPEQAGDNQPQPHQLRTITMPNNRLCECQCGQPTRNRRRFIPGHSIATAKSWRKSDSKNRAREGCGVTIRYPAPNIAPRFNEDKQ